MRASEKSSLFQQRLQSKYILCCIILDEARDTCFQKHKQIVGQTITKGAQQQPVSKFQAFSGFSKNF